MLCIQLSFGWSRQEEGDGRSICHVRREQKLETDHLKELGVDGKIILKYIFKKHNGETWIGFICLRIETDCGRF
jgi:hypothetical protein